ncbi:hypothetical protein MNBD_ALPHA06-83 [hydrothermal vent metagenome]|uniref:Uncharacterized protein n=1 Tax=hydrothermal vent metagenome TaxID=652676 RepID=A0A3B0SA38_9ZZZZ
MFDQKLEQKILDFLPEHGSVSGAELCEAFGQRYFELWRICMNSELLCNTYYARHYLRIDAKLPGFARLSPSILRNFLTYTCISTLPNLQNAIEEGEAKRQIHRDISEKKRTTALRIIEETFDADLLKRVAILIAGDVCRNMAHEVPRPERASGEIVKGSDIDLILVIETEDTELRDELENRLLETKAIYLRHPALREEIDFVVNSLPHYQTVGSFETPSQMISCKTGLESQFLAGNRLLAVDMRSILTSADIPRKVLDLSERAFSERMHTVERLRKNPDAIHEQHERRLFYFSDEVWEFMLDEPVLGPQ